MHRSSPWTSPFWTLTLLLLGGVAAAAEPETVSIDLRLQVMGADFPKDTPGRLVLERLDRTEGPARELPARSRQSVRLPSPSRWSIHFDVPGFWGHRSELDVSSDSSRGWIFNLRPAGLVTGVLSTSTGPVPKTCEIFGELPGGLRAESRCPLDAKGRLHCALPDGSHDLVIAAGTYAPVRFRGARVVRGEALKLPPVELMPGASLVGRVVLDDGSPPGADPGGSVRLLPFSTRATPADEPPRPLLDRPLSADGFFSFVGLAPGSVVLEVTKPGYSTLRFLPLELTAGIEIEVPEPLRLTRPLDVVVEINPTSDPFGQPWQVTLRRTKIGAGAAQEASVAAGNTNVDGHFRATDQDRGRYSLRIEDSAGNGFHHDPELWILEAADASLHVELPLVDVRGEVSRGDQPLSARLFFGGRRGARRVEVETDDQGRFEVTLPEAGPWPVDLVANEIETQLTVEVEPGLDKRRAEIDIEVPDTEIFGRVVDDQAAPVANAEVTVSAEGRPARIAVNRDGEFVSRGLPAGSYSIEAQRRNLGERLASDPQQIALYEGTPLGPLELRLRRMVRTPGRVLRPGGQPVPGAIVSVQAHGAGAFTDSATTDSDGGFSVQTDPNSATWTVTLMAPGASLSVFHRANDGSPFEIRADGDSGQLEIELPVSRDQLTTADYHLLLLRNGVALETHWLFDWRRALGLPAFPAADDRRISVPRLATGSYTACFGHRQQFALLQPGVDPTGASGVGCRSGFLATGGELLLRLPPPPG